MALLTQSFWQQHWTPQKRAGKTEKFECSQDDKADRFVAKKGVETLDLHSKTPGDTEERLHWPYVPREENVQRMLITHL